jgi:hypothetical protein
MLAIVLALLLVTLTHAEKESWGLARCVQEDYDECAVEIAEDEQRMWLHYGCARWNAQAERWETTFDTIVAYQWTDAGVMQLTDPPLVGCPEYF